MCIPLVQAREVGGLGHGGMGLYFRGITSRSVEILEGGIDNGTLLSW